MYDTGNNGDMVQDGSIEMVTMINAALLVYPARRACALRALGLLLADVALTVGWGKILAQTRTNLAFWQNIGIFGQILAF